jgi:hypothetical protein
MTDDSEMLRAKLLNLQTELRQAQEEASRQRLRAEVAIHARAAGLHPSAVDDAAARLLAAGEWKVAKGGEFVRHAAGTVPDVLPNGKSATVLNALKFMKNEAPYFYEDGAVPAQAAPAATVRASVAATTAPKAPERELNMTALSRLVEMDKENARKMMTEANWSAGRIAQYLGDPAPLPEWKRSA